MSRRGLPSPQPTFKKFSCVFEELEHRYSPGSVMVWAGAGAILPSLPANPQVAPSQQGTSGPVGAKKGNGSKPTVSDEQNAHSEVEQPSTTKEVAREGKDQAPVPVPTSMLMKAFEVLATEGEQLFEDFSKMLEWLSEQMEEAGGGGSPGSRLESAFGGAIPVNTRPEDVLTATTSSISSGSLPTSHVEREISTAQQGTTLFAVQNRELNDVNLSLSTSIPFHLGSSPATSILPVPTQPTILISAGLANDTAPNGTTNTDGVTSDPTITIAIDNPGSLTQVQISVLGPETTPEATVAQGTSRLLLSEHHATDEDEHGGHYFATTGSHSHFAWQDQDPRTSAIDIYYDFRAIGSFTNGITPEQQAMAELAIQQWEDGSGGLIRFSRSTTASTSDIINIGVGDLAALGSVSKPGGALALGGGLFVNGEVPSIHQGIVWLDITEKWDVVQGNGNIPGTFDAFTVFAHEIGHALGVGHTDDLPGRDIMDSTYTGENQDLSPNDIFLLQSIYSSSHSRSSSHSQNHVESAASMVLELEVNPQANQITISPEQLAELNGGSLPEGQYGVLITAVDSQGNQGQAEVTFTLDTRGAIAASEHVGLIDQPVQALDVTYNEPVWRQSVTDAGIYTLTIESGENKGQVVAIDRVEHLDTRTVRLHFSKVLDDVSYRLKVAPVSDLAGNVSELQDKLDFTIAESFRITQVTPHNGEAMVNVTRELIIRFSEPVDKDTITEETVKIIALGEEVSGRRVVSTTGRFVIFYPDNPWSSSTEIRLEVDGTKIKALDGDPLDADGDGFSGGMRVADFSTLPLTRIAGTNVYGFVRDSATGKPLAGVTIEVDAFPEANVVTDENGRFELVDMPSPDFFVHINGSTAGNVPNGFYYPVVGKPFHSVPGQTVQLEMDGSPFDIFLPLVAKDDIQQLSSTEETQVGFGENGLQRLAEMFPGLDPTVFENLQVSFAPNGALDEQGNPATEAVIVPVDPERIPAPLPPNLNPQLVISIQAPGATNFDVPAPITFPNLDGLQPGEKSLIFSFDHDAGKWVVIGSGTVNAAGTLIVSDPGVGILAPGWHATQPGTPPEPPEDDCEGFDWGDAWTLFKALGGAFREVANLKPIIETGFDIVNGAGDFIQQVNAARDAYDKSNNRQALIQSLLAANTVKSTVVNGLANFKGAANPIGRGLRAAKVSIDLANTALSLSTKCAGPLGKALANLGSKVLDFASTIIGNLNLLQKSITDVPFRALQLGCGFIDSVLNDLSSVNGLVAHDHQGALRLQANVLSDSAILEALNNGVEQVQFFHNEFTKVSGPTRETLTGLTNALEQLHTQGSKPVLLGVGPAQKGYYRLQVGDTELRGRTSAAGNYNLPAAIAPNAKYTFELYDPAQNALLRISGTSAPSGQPTVFHPERFEIILLDGALDSDNDGLPDVVEPIVGTKVSSPDTDTDGVKDGAEVKQGTNPLDGRGYPTGPLANIPLQGTAEDLYVLGNLIYLATGGHGMAIVNGTQFDNPVLQGQLGLTGNATGIGVSSQLEIAAVATGSHLQLVDVSEPARPALLQSIPIPASRVEVANGIAYAASGNTLRMVDLVTGDVLQVLALSGFGNVTGMAREGTYLYAFVSGNDRFNVIDISREGEAKVVGQLTVFVASSDVGLSAGNGVAWLAGSGLRTIDISDPTNPRQIQGANGFFTARRIALNGSGMGVMAPDGNRSISVYDTSDPNDTNALVTQYNLSGRARNVAISRGIAYVATTSGLEVVNFLPFDNRGIAPTVEISTPVEDLDLNAIGIQVLEGTSIPIQVNGFDDVQIAQVQLLVNGAVVQSDVSFPYDFFALAPTINGEISTFTIQVEAIDTGGNTARSNVLTLEMAEDTFAPALKNITPTEGTVLTEGSLTVRATFSEPLAEESANADSFQLLDENGNVLTPSNFQLRSNDEVVQITYPGLVAGIYQLVISGSVTDRAGNPLGTEDIVRSYTVSPRATLSTSVVDADPGTEGLQVVEGHTVPVNVDLAQGVEPTEVVFFVNGTEVASDRTAPFSFSTRAPLFEPQSDSFSIQARVTDANGFTTVTPELTLGVVEDLVAPTIVEIDPKEGGQAPQAIQSLQVTFSESLAVGSVAADQFQLTHSGENGILGDEDDVQVEITDVTLLGDDHVVELTTAPLGLGLYRLTQNGNGITDRAGNLLAEGSLDSQFEVVPFVTVVITFDAGRGFPPDYSEEGLTVSSQHPFGRHLHLGDQDRDGSPDLLNHSGCCSTPYFFVYGGLPFTLVSVDVAQRFGNGGGRFVAPNGTTVDLVPGTILFEDQAWSDIPFFHWEQFFGSLIIDNLTILAPPLD